jgi:hypothetical protein
MVEGAAVVEDDLLPAVAETKGLEGYGGCCWWWGCMTMIMWLIHSHNIN